MSGSLQRVIVSVVMYSSAFAVAFALAGAGVVALLAALGPEAPPKEQFVTDLVVWIFSLQAAFGGAIAGGMAGVLYALVPKPARDTWMAMAFGAGAALLPLISIGGGAFPAAWVLGLAVAGALAASAAAWFVRKLGAG